MVVQDGLTLPVGVLLDVALFGLSQGVKAEVGQLEDEARVHHAVRRLEVAVGAQLARVEEGHSLETRVRRPLSLCS